MRLFLQRVPPETKVGAAVLGVALVQVGLLAWLGLRTTEQRQAELSGELRDNTQRIVQREVVNAGVSRIAAFEQAAQREIERPGRPPLLRIPDALERAPVFSHAFVVTARGGATQLHDHRRLPLEAPPRAPRDDAVREELTALAVAPVAEAERVVRRCEEIADSSSDVVARALALQTGWRAALATDERRALLLAERARRDLPAVVDDRGAIGESAPFGVSAAAAVCEVWRRAVERAALENAEGFTRAIKDRRELAQRLRDRMSAAAYDVERAECRELLESQRLMLLSKDVEGTRAFLQACDALDAEVDRARSVDPDALTRTIAAREPARLPVPGGVLTVLPLPGADRLGGIEAVALFAPEDVLRAEALAPLRLGVALPEGVLLQVRDADGTVLAGEPGPGERLVERLPFGPAVPGISVSAVLTDPSVLERETASERRLWLWILGAALLAVLAASILAVRAVMREVRLARLKSDFVSNLSHELRTPLTSLRMFVETLQEGRVRDEEERRQCLAFIAQETDRLATLVDRILQFAAFSRGRAPIELRSADVGEVVERALTIFRSRSEASGARVETRLATDLPEALLDRDAMIQVLLNLLDNAVKYGGEDGARILVSARGDGPRVRIEVEDDGPGVPERERELVFEEFYRGDDSLTSPVQGAGIGLALCRRIVLAHGGRIAVDRGGRLGGACFAVTLPEAAVGRRIAVASREAVSARERRA
jgi:two-component system phosphate regulon sensor histidine kinase PhoR